MDLPRPSRTYDLKVNGETKSVIMSYGLFNEIMAVVPSPQNIADLLVNDPFLRDWVIRRMLTGNVRIKADEDLVDPYDLDIDLDEINGLVTWVAEHVLYFFMNTVAKTATVGEKYQDLIKEMNEKAAIQSNQSQTGAED